MFLSNLKKIECVWTPAAPKDDAEALGEVFASLVAAFSEGQGVEVVLKF